MFLETKFKQYLSVENKKSKPFLTHWLSQLYTQSVTL